MTFLLTSQINSKDMELSPQQQKVVDFLADGEWHCMADGFFMKDDRKRISELNALKFEIIGIKCDKRCGINHSSRVQMRRLVERPDGITVHKKEQHVEFITLPDGTRGVRLTYA